RRQRKAEGQNQLARLGLHVEGEARILQADTQRVGAVVAPGHAKAVLFDEIVDRDRSFVLLIGGAAIDRALIQRDGIEPSARGGALRAHIRSPRASRSATERACALKPSASPSAMAAGPKASSARRSQRSTEVRLRKSLTPRPEEKRAERAVGSTWL